MAHHHLTVVAAGVATTVQDRGRPGMASLGVPRAGAVDTALHDLVNRLVGNTEDAATLETAGRLVVRADGPLVIAITAEAGPRSLVTGEALHVDPSPGEQWAYLAVRGGLAVEPVLGSRSRDTLSGTGPTPPTAGDELAVGDDPGTPVLADVAPRPLRAAPTSIRIWPGPRVDWFEPATIEQLVDSPWTVSADISRVGVRLEGPQLHRRGGELPSEALVLGAIQVPPDGRPVVMLADHPTTGGYPVVAVVDPSDIGALAQSRSGALVRLRRA